MDELNEDIFSGGNSINNPYTPESSTKFEIPVDIADTIDAIDDHGQLNSEFLDEVFEYIEISDSGIQYDGNTPDFTAPLREDLANIYWIAQLVNDLIERYEDCEDDDDSDIAAFCTVMVNFLEGIRDTLIARGLTRDRLDTSVSLLVGNKTTIGQVCSFARGLEDKIVDDLPGFCCLDAPYEVRDDEENTHLNLVSYHLFCDPNDQILVALLKANNWGEKVREIFTRMSCIFKCHYFRLISS